MDILQLLTGVLISGESIALFLGMRLQKSEWLNPINKGYLVFDVVVGALLVSSSLGLIFPPVILVVTSIVTHLIRDYDHYKNIQNRYAFNLPLMILLNIRLLGLIIILLR